MKSVICRCWKLSLALGKRSRNSGFGKRSSKLSLDVAEALAARGVGLGARPHWERSSDSGTIAEATASHRQDRRKVATERMLPRRATPRGRAACPATSYVRCVGRAPNIPPPPVDPQPAHKKRP